MEFNEQEAKPVYSRSVTIAIDADSLIYRAAHIGEKICLEAAIPKDNPLFKELSPDLHLEQRVVLRSMIDGIVEDVTREVNSKGCDIKAVELHYTPKGHIQRAKGLSPNFRYGIIDAYNEMTQTAELEDGEDREDIHPGYKSGRAGMKLPDGLTELFDFAVEDERAVLSDGCESDDVVCYQKAIDIGGTVICALDKDILNGSPSGELGHFNFNKKEWVYTTSEEAELNIHRQCLTGDSSDTIKGIFRYGPKTAEKDLPEWTPSLWEDVLAIFLKKGYSYNYAVLMMRLVDMHQYKGQEEGTVLWTPPTVVPEECVGCKYLLSDGNPSRTCLHCVDFDMYQENEAVVD